MKFITKHDVKNILGQIPLTAEAYWYIRQPGKPITPEFTLDRLEQAIPQWSMQIMGSKLYNASSAKPAGSRKNLTGFWKPVRFVYG